jgi:hypothetical protein
MGARAMGMAYASSCSKDEWAIFNNPGGLAEIKNSVAAFSYNAYPSFKTFNRMAATISIPLKLGVTGLGVFRYGDNIYNEEVVSAGFSNRFGLASLGVKVNYIQYSAEGFGTKGVVTVSFGGIATLTEKLMVGAYITNINQPKISPTESAPSRLAAGFGYKPSEKILVCTEVEKDLAKKATWKTGMEYQFNNKFFIRTGFSISPDAAFAGFGFRPKKIAVDYALQYNFIIGLNHQATVAFKLKSK